jgi:hypothetical protein
MSLAAHHAPFHPPNPPLSSPDSHPILLVRNTQQNRGLQVAQRWWQTF